ncbi:MAG: hypothetical protein RBT70_01015 [Alphaproteobacteria bacterium]|jgi:hypothetical protein|nr:hypothetical protein [Alphaproteobacteria bacterium]
MNRAPHPRRIVDQITTQTDKRFEAVARMADAIVEIAAASGDCTQQDLLAKGFANQDLAALWHFANALAVIELKCRENGMGSSFEKEVRYA